jgi:hypothetical protein
MTVTVFHLRQSVDRDERLSVTDPVLGDWKTAWDDGTYEDKKSSARVSAAMRLWEAGGYEEVARVEGDDLDVVFRVTNNIETSWSREPARGVAPTAPGYVEHNGKRYGYRSSSVGDIFRLGDGSLHVVDTSGFRQL